MKVLVIGGTGFIGPHLVRELQAMGHEVAVFHRGPAVGLAGVEHIPGDRRNLRAHRDALLQFSPDIVVDLILSSGRQAQELVDVLNGISRRLVIASSIDVYRAFGVLHGTEPGPPEPVPLTEDSPLRTRSAYTAESLKGLQGVFTWVDDAYDKVDVERAVMQVPGTTVLRLPAIHGPGDHLHRLWPLLKRMDDGRTRILLSADVAGWRWPRGYVENVAAAIALAVVDERAAGRIYNVAEEEAFSELEWAHLVAAHAGWRGKFVVMPPAAVPKHLLQPGNFAQHLSASSRRIREELGYREPVAQAEGLRRTIAWEREHPSGLPIYQFDYAAEDAALATSS